MDLSIAILHYRPKSAAVRFEGGPEFRQEQFEIADYEIALVDERTSLNSAIDPAASIIEDPLNSPPSASGKSAVGSSSDNLQHVGATQQPMKLIKSLPRCRMSFDQDATEVAHRLFGRTFQGGVKCLRAIPVSLWKSEPSTPSHSGESMGNSVLTGALFCCPLPRKDRLSPTPARGRLKLHPLDQVLQYCHHSSSLIDTETRHLLLRLEEWLRERQETQPSFIERVFLRPAAAGRALGCVHSPAHLDELKSCAYRVPSPPPSTHSMQDPDHHHQENSNPNEYTCELREEARRANLALTKMMALEKCDSFIMNPLFGSGLPYRIGHGQQVVMYMALGRPEPPKLNPQNSLGNNQSSESSDSGSWIDDFPLHRYAIVGNGEQLSQLIKQGLNVNRMDADSWAPIHYAAWYGQLAAVQVLINTGNCDVNVRNRNGSTPLHFAAWCGHQYVVELLLSHPDIHLSLKDKDGKTPLDLCECVPKPEWQNVAKLLKSAEKDKFPKIQVDLMDGSNVMLSLVQGNDTTAQQLHQQICLELKLSDACGRLFALWICSDSLQLQLKAEHKPVKHIAAWQSNALNKFADVEKPTPEMPRLVFRRDAKLSLIEERKVRLNDVALGLLFHEAHHNYIRGLYPCREQDDVFLAAIYLQIIRGNYDPRADKQFLSSERSLSMLLPQHKLKQKGSLWIQKVIAEHKLVTERGAKHISGLQYQYLSCCWNLRVYGSAFFNAIIYMSKPVKGTTHVHVGVNDFGLHVINAETKNLTGTYPYKILKWQIKPDRPYIEFTSDATREQLVHEFTVRTRQASLVHTLLSRLSSGFGDSPISSEGSSPSLKR